MVAGPVASQPFSGVAVPGVSARLLARPPSRTRRAAAPARAASARGGLARRLDQEQRTIISPPLARAAKPALDGTRSEEHTSEIQSLMRISYAGFCLKKTHRSTHTTTH